MNIEQLYGLAAKYDLEGGGGNQFSYRASLHLLLRRRTAAYEALLLCRKFYPWRCAR